jgi:hypothetical protein
MFSLLDAPVRKTKVKTEKQKKAVLHHRTPN